MLRWFLFIPTSDALWTSSSQAAGGRCLSSAAYWPLLRNAIMRASGRANTAEANANITEAGVEISTLSVNARAARARSASRMICRSDGHKWRGWEMLYRRINAINSVSPTTPPSTSNRRIHYVRLRCAGVARPVLRAGSPRCRLRSHPNQGDCAAAFSKLGHRSSRPLRLAASFTGTSNSLNVAQIIRAAA